MLTTQSIVRMPNLAPDGFILKTGDVLSWWVEALPGLTVDAALAGPTPLDSGPRYSLESGSNRLTVR